MRQSLLKSFLFVVIFWWIAFALYWGLAQPEATQAVALKLQSWLPFSLNLPAKVTIFNAWEVQLKVISYWTIPVFILAVLSAAMGVGFASWRGIRYHKERMAREAGSGLWRGMTLTLGELPGPTKLKSTGAEFDVGGTALGAILNPAQQKVLGEILATLEAYSSLPSEPVKPSLLRTTLAKWLNKPVPLPAKPLTGYSGEEGKTLLDVTLERLAKLMERADKPSANEILVTAALNLGYPTSYMETASGEWLKLKNPYRIAARMLAVLDSWWDIAPEDRLVVSMAVCYADNPKLIPNWDGKDTVRAKATQIIKNLNSPGVKQQTSSIVPVIASADPEIEIPQVEYSAEQLPDLVLKSFVDILPTLPFQTPGLPKSIKAIGWKKKGLLYLIEIQVRERTMAQMPQGILNLLSSSKEKTKLAPFTHELLKSLDKAGWLLREHEGIKVPVGEALWKVKAGTKDFKGVIILSIPPELKEMLPTSDTLYDMIIEGPQYGAATGAAIASAADLSGLLGAPSGQPRPQKKPGVKPEGGATESGKPAEASKAIPAGLFSDLKGDK